MNSKKLFQRDFLMVVAGQIISLFGNAILRFALPLYLLNQTKSPVLFGIVSACSFIPVILLSPIGGILADRINKRNIMVILDFFTAFLVLMLTLLLGKADLVMLLLTALILLYGIQGTYQPAVQASIPVLVCEENLMPANAVINLVNSLAGLIGPVIGGAVFSIAGIRPILMISIACFVFSAVMEIFIHIPFQKRAVDQSILAIAGQDIRQGFAFIRTEKPIIGKVTLLVASINLFFSALIIIGLPIIVTQQLGFSEELGNRLYGYAQGALAAGGLTGGLLAGALGRKMNIKRAYWLLALCSASLLPMGLALWLPIPVMATYIIIVLSCFLMMVLSSMFSIQMLSYAQVVTPEHLLGKIMSMVMCISMIAQPLGQAVYGVLFKVLEDQVYLLCFGAMVICMAIALMSRRLFEHME